MFKNILAAALLLAINVMTSKAVPGDISVGGMMPALVPRSNAEAFANGLPPLRQRHHGESFIF
jgi:hypothetical protein